MPDITFLATAIAIVVLLLVVLWLAIRVVNRGDKLVVYRLGNTDDSLVKGPGLVLLIPFVDRPQRVNLREQYVEVPSQTAITKDNVTIPIDFLIYWRIIDPLKSVVNVQDFVGALAGVATTNLRAVVGDFLLDDVLSKRDLINESLRTKLDEITENWGGKVTRVEIREITPPRDILDSMNRMLSAERNRRAVITESEGARQSAINVAEGQKQSEILKAEGQRQAAILKAEGFSLALTRIFEAASGVDQKTMALQYLEALKALGEGPATKFVIPFEFTRLLEPFLGYVKPVEGDAPSGGSPVRAGAGHQPPGKRRSRRAWSGGVRAGPAAGPVAGRSRAVLGPGRSGRCPQRAWYGPARSYRERILDRFLVKVCPACSDLHPGHRSTRDPCAERSQEERSHVAPTGRRGRPVRPRAPTPTPRREAQSETRRLDRLSGAQKSLPDGSRCRATAEPVAAGGAVGLLEVDLVAGHHGAGARAAGVVPDVDADVGPGPRLAVDDVVLDLVVACRTR